VAVGVIKMMFAAAMAGCLHVASILWTYFFPFLILVSNICIVLILHYAQ